MVYRGRRHQIDFDNTDLFFTPLFVRPAKCFSILRQLVNLLQREWIKYSVLVLIIYNTDNYDIVESEAFFNFVMKNTYRLIL